MRRFRALGGRVFVQMEDELASIASVIGASWAGAKAMTATSGPGLSLMLENLGYAIMTETPSGAGGYPARRPLHRPGHPPGAGRCDASALGRGGRL